MPDINIEENGILKLLKEVNVYNAIGPDLIPNCILKDCCVELAPILTQIYKKSLREGRLLQDWLSANVTAIFKKGARHEARNYRPVSLTSETCKIFEHVLFSQIMRLYTIHMFINPLQHGFQKGLSCDTQLATTVYQLQKRLDDKQQVDLIILDFQKAFDKLPHRHRLHKHHESGIQGQLHEWLTCYLTERTQRVIVDGCESTEARVISGVPQGTVLGPLMFLTYINDITCGINGQMRLFADDALLYYPVRTIADGASMQHDLHTLYIWSKSWKMAFNGKKCHVMHVTRNITITRCSYTLGHLALPCPALPCFVLFCFVLLCFVLLCFALFGFVWLCFALLCFALFGSVWLCFVWLCLALFCFALFCFALFCFVWLCLALLCFVLLCLALFGSVLLCFALFCLALFCFVLLCFALFCFVLLCFALFGFVLLCFALFCFVWLCFALFCSVLFGFVWLCFALFCFVLLCFALFCFVLLCFALFCFVWLCLALFGFVWLCLALFGFTWLCLALFGFAWLCLALLGFVWLCFALFGFVLLCLALFGFVWLCLALFGFVLALCSLEVFKKQITRIYNSTFT